MSTTATRRASAQEDEDSSPEVDFGAFFRGSSSRPSSRAASAYFPSAPATSVAGGSTSPTEPKRMRQGAPRLGGLGLGGIGVARPMSTPSPSSTPPPGAISRPFLSPELNKPVARAEPFALQRPVPVARRPSEVEVAPEEAEEHPSPALSLPLSPSFTSSPSFGEIAQRIEEVVEQEEKDLEKARFQGLQAALELEQSRAATSSSRSTEEDEHDSIANSSLFATPEIELDEPTFPTLTLVEPDLPSTPPPGDVPAHNSSPSLSSSEDSLPELSPSDRTDRERSMSESTTWSGPQTPPPALGTSLHDRPAVVVVVEEEERQPLEAVRPISMSSGLYDRRKSIDAVVADISPPISRPLSPTPSIRSTRSARSTRSTSRGPAPPRPKRLRPVSIAGDSRSSTPATSECGHEAHFIPSLGPAPPTPDSIVSATSRDSFFFHPPVSRQKELVLDDNGKLVGAEAPVAEVAKDGEEAPIVSGLGLDFLSNNAVPRPPRSITESSSVEDPATPTNDGRPDPIAELGAAAVGALVSGGVAVGYSAWKGLSAAATAGWGWGTARTSRMIVEEVEVASEADRESIRSHVSKAEVASALEDAGKIVEETEAVAAGDVISPTLSVTEWGELDFPTPAGFYEAFEAAMAEIGPEDVAANEQTEIDAQQAAYFTAQQLHDEAKSPVLPADFSAHARRPMPFPNRVKPDKRRSMIELDPRRLATAQDDSGDYDELIKMISPMFDTAAPPRVAPRSPPSTSRGFVASRPSAQPLSRTLSGSTAGSGSSFSVMSFAARVPGPPSTLSATSSTPSAPERSHRRRHSFFSFGSKSKTPSSPPPPPPIPTATRRHGRSMSIDSSSTSSTSHEKPTNKLQRKSKVASVFPTKAAATPEPTPTPAPAPAVPASKRRASIDSAISNGDTPYVSYRRLSVAPASPTPPLPAKATEIIASHINPYSRRSSLRAVSKYDGTNIPRTSWTDKKVYTVRFANAAGGIGLRAVAENEATRGGGDSVLKWVGVGRGTYGGSTDMSSDEMYATQTAQIKSRWRSRPSRDWTTVRVD